MAIMHAGIPSSQQQSICVRCGDKIIITKKKKREKPATRSQEEEMKKGRRRNNILKRLNQKQHSINESNRDRGRATAKKSKQNESSQNCAAQQPTSALFYCYFIGC